MISMVSNRDGCVWGCWTILHQYMYIVRLNATHLGAVNWTNVCTSKSKEMNSKSAKYTWQTNHCIQTVDTTRKTVNEHTMTKRKRERVGEKEIVCVLNPTTVDLKLNAMYTRNAIVRLLTQLHIDIKLNRKRESSMRALTVEALGSNSGKSMNREQKQDDEGKKNCMRTTFARSQSRNTAPSKKKRKILNWQIVCSLHFSISSYTTCTHSHSFYIKICACTFFTFNWSETCFMFSVSRQNFVEIMKNSSVFMSDSSN